MIIKKELLDKYKELFKEDFSTFPFRSMGIEKIEEILKHCIKEKKDVYILGYLSNEEDVYY